MARKQERMQVGLQLKHLNKMNDLTVSGQQEADKINL